MSQFTFFDPQFECGIFEIWCRGIITNIAYRAANAIELSPYGVNEDSTLDQKITNSGIPLNLPSLRGSKPELYDVLLAKAGILVREVCSQIPDPCEKMDFKTRFVDLIFLNVLKERELLIKDSKYYYESVLDLFGPTLFGLEFFLDSIADQGWYIYASKFLSNFKEPEQVQLIAERINTFSSDYHLNVLITIWSLRDVINNPEDDQILAKFQNASSQLVQQTQVNRDNFDRNLAIYLTLVNVYLEEILVVTSRHAARVLKIDEHKELENPAVLDFPPVAVPLQNLEPIQSFINLLFDQLFSREEFKTMDQFITCFKDTKNETIVEMMANIVELYGFLGIVSKEITDFPYSQTLFDGFAEIQNSWEVWKKSLDLEEIFCWAILSLKRFFKKGRIECRYLTLVTIKNGLPLYLDILESVESDVYLDPNVFFSLCNHILKVNQVDLYDDLVRILERVLKYVKSKKRLSAAVKARVNLFGLFTLGMARQSKLPLLLNCRSGALRYDQLRDDIILSAFLLPFEFTESLIAETLEHHHHSIPFLVKLLCIELNGIASAICTKRFKNTFFEALLNQRLSTTVSANTVKGIMLLIKEVHLFYINAKLPVEPAIMSLERLMHLLAWNICMNSESCIEAKVTVFKLIRTLSDQIDDSWDFFQEKPSPLIYSILTLFDFFYDVPIKKPEVLDLLHDVISHKLGRKISVVEFEWIKCKIIRNGEDIVMLAYLEPWLEHRLSCYFDVKIMETHQTFLMASITQENRWIYDKLRETHANFRVDQNLLRTYIEPCLPLMTRSEFDNLFRFLCYSNDICNSINALCDAYMVTERRSKDEHGYLVTWLLDCIDSNLRRYWEDPQKFVGHKIWDKEFLKNEKGNTIPFIFRWAALMLHNKTNNTGDRQKIYGFLHKIAKEMKEMNVDVQKAYFEKPNEMAKECQYILYNYFDNVGPYHRTKKEPRRIPG